MGRPVRHSFKRRRASPPGLPVPSVVLLPKPYRPGPMQPPLPHAPPTALSLIATNPQTRVRGVRGD